MAEDKPVVAAETKAVTEEVSEIEDGYYELMTPGTMQWDSETGNVWDDAQPVRQSPLTTFVASRIGRTLKQVPKPG